MTETILKGIPITDLESKMIALGHSAYRGRQLFRWIYQKRERQFDRMTDLSKHFRADLSKNYTIPAVELAESHESTDGTVKYLVKLHDGKKVESVFIPNEKRNTLCISTQVGCKMACSFCATGYQGFIRNLNSWEIVDQAMALPFPAPIRNVVLMGMGEPFDNYEEIIKALRIFQDPMGLQIGKRHITVSTVGLTDKIPEFVQANLGKLAISLHGSTEEQRAAIMPISRKYPIERLMQTCRQLRFKGPLRVTFEYLLIKDFNDSIQDARRLVRLLRGIPNKVNLIAYNENRFIDFKRPSEERILSFQRELMKAHITVTYRRSRGRDIAAACGQLVTGTKPSLKR